MLREGAIAAPSAPRCGASGSRSRSRCGHSDRRSAHGFAANRGCEPCCHPCRRARGHATDGRRRCAATTPTRCGQPPTSRARCRRARALAIWSSVRWCCPRPAARDRAVELCHDVFDGPFAKGERAPSRARSRSLVPTEAAAGASLRCPSLRAPRRSTPDRCASEDHRASAATRTSLPHETRGRTPCSAASESPHSTKLIEQKGVSRFLNGLDRLRAYPIGIAT
jgi:hypothetical protein